MCGCDKGTARRASIDTLPSLEERQQMHADGLLLLAPDHPFATIDSPHYRRPCDPRTVMVDDLIARADDFVTVGDDGTAVIAKAIRKHLTEQEIEHVEAMVAIHNLKLHTHPRVPVAPPTPPTDDTASTQQPLGDPPPPPAPAPCTPNAFVTFYWWGFRIHLDHCFCKMIPLFGTAAAGISGSIAAILVAAGAGGPWVGLAAALIALMAAWITWADGYCTPNVGANYNQSWTVQGWITTNC